MAQIYKIVVIIILITLSTKSFASSLTCNSGDVLLESMQLSTNDAIPPPVIDFTGLPVPGYAPNGRSATNCVGLLRGNDMPKPTNNIGEVHDGLLNGADQTGGITDPSLNPNTLFQPGAFIANADLQDVDNDGLVDDPGWVMLGRTNGESGTLGFDFEGVLDMPNFIADVLGVEIKCLDLTGCTQGTWSVTPDFDIVEQIDDVFGDSFFDHLAFVFKTGNVKHQCHNDEQLPVPCDSDDATSEVSTDDKGPKFAVYDFNFNTIRDELGGSIDLSVPYILKGSFDLGATFDGKDISHVSLWARDPIDTDIEISEPANFVLFCTALLLLVFRYYLKKEE